MFGRFLDYLRDKKHNMYINNLIDRGLYLGKNTQIVDECFLDHSHCHLIRIEDNCTIAPKVSFLAHDASTFKFLGYSKIGKIHIQSNCFIGLGAIIMPNVTIGENCIVAAGSVVTKDVPSNSIVAGNPARVLTQTSEYLEKIEALLSEQGNRILDEDYSYERLTPERLAHMRELVDDGIAFIR